MEQLSPDLRFHLLIAEDNLPDALLVREAIKEANLNVEIYAAVDGQAALQFLSNAENEPNAPRFDLLVLDLNLPKHDGFDILRHARASSKFHNVPVVIMTSSDAPRDRQQAAELGASYFRKPPSYFDFMKIGLLIEGLLKKPS